jgi:1-phosphatidylinositol-3-phosphate 5-kinase
MHFIFLRFSFLLCYSEWAPTLEKLVRRCVARVRPFVRGGDDIDVARYVKAKTLAGGRRSDSAYVDGLLFRKHAAHTKMRSFCRQPRVLLLSCALELQRVRNRHSAIDAGR